MDEPRIHLQLALDQGRTDELIGIARLAEPHVDWIEAGTPWILSEGLGVVRKLREAFPERQIVADLKIADAGELEAEMAFAAGADIVSVLGIAGDLTLQGALRAAGRHRGRIVVDLLHIPEPANRSREAIDLGASLVVYHVAYDDPLVGLRRMPEVSQEARGAIVVAGGIRLEDILAVARFRPAAIIVGRAIMEAPDPEAAARAFREALDREARR